MLHSEFVCVEQEVIHNSVGVKKQQEDASRVRGADNLETVNDQESQVESEDQKKIDPHHSTEAGNFYQRSVLSVIIISRIETK